MNAMLIIGEAYQRAPVAIDVTTFHFEGHKEGYDNYNRDAYISFRLSDPNKTQLVTDYLRHKLNRNVDKTEYVKARFTFQTWETDKRPSISVRLPSGAKGWNEGANFSFRETTDKEIVAIYGDIEEVVMLKDKAEAILAKV